MVPTYLPRLFQSFIRKFSRMYQEESQDSTDLTSKGYNLRERDSSPMTVSLNGHDEIMEELEVEMKEDLLLTPKSNRLRERNAHLDLKHERKANQNKQDLNPAGRATKKNLFKEEPELAKKPAPEKELPTERGLW
jgi:hypothetical protein